MSEAEIAHLMALNRQAFVGWLQTSLILTLAVFFLAYVIRSTPQVVRGAVFLVFLVGSFNFMMVMNLTNAGFLQLVQDLAGVSPQTGYAQGIVAGLGATPTQAPVFPLWARVGSPLIFLINLGVGFYLLLLAKWER